MLESAPTISLRRPQILKLHEAPSPNARRVHIRQFAGDSVSQSTSCQRNSDHSHHRADDE